MPRIKTSRRTRLPTMLRTKSSNRKPKSKKMLGMPSNNMNNGSNMNNANNTNTKKTLKPRRTKEKKK